MNLKSVFLAAVFALSGAPAYSASFPTFQCMDEEGVSLSISIVGIKPRYGLLATAIQGGGVSQTQYRGQYLQRANQVQVFLETERATENQYSQLYVRLETNFSEQTAEGSYRAIGPFGDERVSKISCQVKR